MLMFSPSVAAVQADVSCVLLICMGLFLLIHVCTYTILSQVFPLKTLEHSQEMLTPTSQQPTDLQQMNAHTPSPES